MVWRDEVVVAEVAPTEEDQRQQEDRAKAIIMRLQTNAAMKELKYTEGRARCDIATLAIVCVCVCVCVCVWYASIMCTLECRAEQYQLNWSRLQAGGEYQPERGA